MVAVGGYLALRLVLPPPSIVPLPTEASQPFAALFAIANTGDYVPMHNLLWYCIMTPAEGDHRVPIVDLGQFQQGRQGTKIGPHGTETHECRETAALRDRGTYEMRISVEFETRIKIWRWEHVFARHAERSGLRWRIDDMGGRWVD